MILITRHSAEQARYYLIIVFTCIMLLQACAESIDDLPNIVPLDFSFSDKNDVALSDVIFSESVQITGFNSATPISITAGEYSLDGGPFTSEAATINSNQSVQVRHTSASGFSTNTDTVLTIGGISGTFTSTTLVIDIAPDAFSFIGQNNIALSTLIASNSIILGGINSAVAISIIGGEYAIDGGGFTNSAGTINNGQSVQVRHTSASGFSTNTDTVLTIGGISDTFTSTTAVIDITPDAFSFTDKADAIINSEQISSTISITGINSPVAISITGGEFAIGAGSYTSAATTITNGEVVQVRHTSADDFAMTTDTVLTIGGVSDTYSSVTMVVPTYTMFQNANVVIGQDDFITAVSATQDNRLYGPEGSIGIMGTKLYVADTSNQRILGFDTIPILNNEAADFVLGQTDFTSFAGGTSASKLNQPLSPTITNSTLIAADALNHRVLLWTSLPTSAPPATNPATYALGQVDLDSNNLPGTCAANSLNVPVVAIIVGAKVIVSDSFNNRVLIWNTMPTSSGTNADLVLGQQDFSHCARNDTDNDGSTNTPTAQTLSAPYGIWSDGTRLVVSDTDNHRVLIWNTFPSSNFTAADLVLGQGDFVHVSANDDDQNNVSDALPTNKTLYSPSSIFSNGSQLFVADADNNRVLLWQAFPTTNFQTADVVLGQADFISNTVNDDDNNGVADASPSARTLKEPMGINQLGVQLFITDMLNNRILIYDGTL